MLLLTHHVLLPLLLIEPSTVMQLVCCVETNTLINFLKLALNFVYTFFFYRGPCGYGCCGRCYYRYRQYTGPGHRDGKKELVEKNL